MRIVFSPQRRDDPLIVSKTGETLTINGADFDFSGIPDGQFLPAEAFASPLVADARRESGTLTVTLTLPLPANPTANMTFPDAIDDAQDGDIPVPQGE